MNERKTIILSGGNTTQGLTEKLIDQYDVAILEPQIAGAHFQRFGNKVIPINGLIDANLQHKAVNIAAQMAGSALANYPYLVNQIQNQHEIFSRNGLANELGAWFPAYLNQSLQRQAIQALALDRLAQQKKISLIVTHEDVTEMYGGLAAWGNAHGIFTMHIPHGNSFMTKDYSPDVHETSISACIAGTPHEETFYRERGYAGEIRITGSPIFDRWANIQPDRAWARRMFKLDADKPVVVYLSSWGQQTNANDDLTIFERAFDAMMFAAKGTNWQVVIKMHPGEAQGMEQNYIERAQALGVKCIVMRAYMDLILTAADLVISVGATNALIDAALVNVPSVSMNIYGFRVNHPAVREVEPEGVKGEIEFALSNAGKENWEAHRDDLIKQMAYKNDGRATERIAQWICEKVN